MVDTTSVNDITSVGQPSGVEKTLPSYIGPYVNTMLGKGAALANQPYQGYKGQISAGYSDLQNQAFQGLANLTVPTGQMGAYQPRSFTGQTPQMPGAYQPQNQGMMPQPMLGAYQPQNQGMGANIAGSNPMMGASMMPQSLSMSENISDDPNDLYMQNIANSAFAGPDYSKEQMGMGGAVPKGYYSGPLDGVHKYGEGPLAVQTQQFLDNNPDYLTGGTQAPQINSTFNVTPEQPQKYANHWEEDRAFYAKKAEIDEARRQRQQDPVAMAELERINSTFKAPQIDSSLPMKPPQSQGMGGTISDMLGDRQAQRMTPPQRPPMDDQIMQARRMMEDQRMTSPQGQGIAQQYMNPYLQASLEPQIAEARRQAAVTRNENAGRLTRAGAFGGGRQAIMESEGQRNMLRNVADVTAKGYNSAYDQARRLFESEEARFRTGQEDTNKFGRDTLNAQMVGGNRQRAIEKEGITADMNQFNLERDYPYQQAKYMQGLLQGLPLGAQNTTYNQPSDFGQASINSSNILAQLKAIIGS